MDQAQHQVLVQALIDDAARRLSEAGVTEAGRLDAERLPVDSPLWWAAEALLRETRAALDEVVSVPDASRLCRTDSTPGLPHDDVMSVNPPPRTDSTRSESLPMDHDESPSTPPVLHLDAESAGEPPTARSRPHGAEQEPDGRRGSEPDSVGTESDRPPSPATAAPEDDAESVRDGAPLASPKLAFAISANARVDEPFSARLIVRGGDPDATEIIECTIPDGLGLTYRAADRSVHGTPTRSGDFSLTVRYRFHGTSEDRPQMTANVPLTVNPDPRTLWQDRPSDRNAPGWKPDADGCLIPAGAGRRILAASKRGRSHAHFGGFRDDDFCVRVRDDSPWSLIAVTDGAGSAEQARTGSRIVANVAADFAAERLAGELGDALTLAAKGIPEADPVATRQMRTKAYEVLGGAALAAVKAIEETADRQGLSPRDYATTLLLAAHRMLGDEHIVITFWAGDGAMVVLEEAGATLLGEPDGGAFAGQTRFLDRSIVGDANEIMTRIHVLRVSDLLGLLVMTDGVSDAHFASDQALAEKVAWDAFWGQVQPILEAEDPVADLLRWLDFWSPGNHDDRTIAIFW